MQVLSGEGRFRDLLGRDGDITVALSPAEIDGCFDLDHALAHTGAIIDRALRAE
jgi:adenylosuccinate lyase